MKNRDSTYPKFNLLILAGGESSRMTFPKPWLPFNETHTFLQHIISSYKRFECNRPIVVLNQKFIRDYTGYIDEIRRDVDIIPNHAPEKGKMYSLKLGANSIHNNCPTFIHNVDNPYAEYSTISALLSSRNTGVLKPVINGVGGHPTLVNSQVLSAVSNANDDENLRFFLSNYPCQNVAVKSSTIFCNLNTPQNYLDHFQRTIPSFVNT